MRVCAIYTLTACTYYCIVVIYRPKRSVRGSPLRKTSSSAAAAKLVVRCVYLYTFVERYIVHNNITINLHALITIMYRYVYLILIYMQMYEPAASVWREDVPPANRRLPESDLRADSRIVIVLHIFYRHNSFVQYTVLLSLTGLSKMH